MSTVIVTGGSLTGEDAPFLSTLRDAGFEVRLVLDERFLYGPITEQLTVDTLRGAAAVIASGEHYTARVLTSLSDLRVIARSGVGYDRVDIDAATRHGTVVTITPTANHEALALVLAYAKTIVVADREMRSGGWPVNSSRPLRGQTLGIVGLGRIGRSLAVRALALRMKVIATELFPDHDFVHACHPK